MIDIDIEVAQKFIDRAYWQGDCLIFDREVDKDGYGVFRQMKNKVKRKWRAHRVAYWLATGDAADGFVIRHSCDNPPCINPAHLAPGTQGQNVGDTVERGRARGRFSTRCANGHEWRDGSWVMRHGRRRCTECEPGD